MAAKLVAFHAATEHLRNRLWGLHKRERGLEGLKMAAVVGILDVQEWRLIGRLNALGVSLRQTSPEIHLADTAHELSHAKAVLCVLVGRYHEAAEMARKARDFDTALVCEMGWAESFDLTTRIEAVERMCQQLEAVR